MRRACKALIAIEAIVSGRPAIAAPAAVAGD
jgi:hypothetical protein